MSRTAGPLGGGRPGERPDDGTLQRLRTPTPGPHGLNAPGAVKLSGEMSVGLRDQRSAAHHRQSSPTAPRFGPRRAIVAMPQIKQGDTGPSVRKLQNLLNDRSWAWLRVDGMFGPRTREAVIAYQHAMGIRPDGVVGIHTLASLVFVDPNNPVASVPVSAASQRPINIHEWPAKDVIIEVLKRTGDHLGPDLRAQWNQLISPASLEMIAGTMVIVLAAHALGVGEVADAIMLGIGVLYLGSGAIDGAKELGAFLATVVQAATPRDLDRAAEHLAKAIVILGITAVMTWLLKRSVKAGGGEAANARATAPRGGGPLAGATDAEIDNAIEGMKPAGDLIELGPHGAASRNRGAMGVSGRDIESAHGMPQAVGRGGVPGYNPNHALTRLMARADHAGMDSYWKQQFQAMRASGRTQATAQEIYNVVAESIRRAPTISAGEKTSLIARLFDEMFMESGLRPGDLVPLPYPNIRPP